MFEKILRVLQEFYPFFIMLGGTSFCYNLVSSGMWGTEKRKINRDYVSFHVFLSGISSICIALAFTISSIAEQKLAPTISLVAVLLIIQLFFSIGFVSLGDIMGDLLNELNEYMQSDEYKNRPQKRNTGVSGTGVFWFIMWLIKH